MIRKTYGVSGLIDWTTNIRVGKANVNFHFAGGALTAYGVTPAKYATANPFFQSVIEGSEYFRNGRIRLLGQMEVPDDAAAIARKERLARREGQAEAKVADDAAAEAPEAGEGSAEADDANTAQTVEVADKNEAIEYLKEKYNPSYTATQLRTKAAFEAACRECGVTFVFTA